ncbi:MAG: CesT family type III secretion system chaperone [Castellaniella sp.]
MARNEHHAAELERFLALGVAEVPQLREFIIDGSPTGLTRIRTAEGEDWIIACVDVGTVSATHADALHRLFLQANHLWAGTHGNTLGLYGDDDAVVLSRSVRAAEVSPQALEKILCSLVADARRWLAHLARELSPALD